MKHALQRSALVLGLLASPGVCPAVFAANNPLGFYLGVGVGRGTVREDQSMSDSFYVFDQHDTGWDVFAGLRPISFLGAEMAYIDFGHPSVDLHVPSAGPYTDINADAKATAVIASALGYLPLPIPWLDLYGKAGLARLQTEYRISDTGIHCVSGYLARLSARLEYQRVNASSGNPDLLSLGVAWTF